MSEEKHYQRTAIDTPKSLVNDDGTCNYGTFKDSFDSFNLLNYKRKFFSKFIKKMRLTEWEAVEILNDDFFLIAAVFKNGPLNFNLIQLYDIKNNELHDFGSKSLFVKKSQTADNLYHNNVYERNTKTNKLRIINNLDKGYSEIQGSCIKGNKTLEIDIKITRVADPSVVCIPLTTKNPLYTEKDLLIPEGIIKFNGKKISFSKKHIAFIDDHRGYYPYNSGYDWVTTMHDIEYRNKKAKFGINLTSFYKVDEPHIYNENGYWLEGEYHTLPLVKFLRQDNKWHITDENNNVDLTFTQLNKHQVYFNLLAVKLDYILAFGKISGTIKTKDGDTITIDNKFALGEKRYTRI